jgi:hypothetical protein
MKLNENDFYRWSGQSPSTLARETKFVRVLQFAYNITQMHFQRPGNTQKDINCRNTESSFNLAHINRIYINPFCQLFLRQMRRLPVFANTFAEEFSIFFCDHNWPQSQTGKPGVSQILLAIICGLRFFSKWLKRTCSKSEIISLTRQ